MSELTKKSLTEIANLIKKKEIKSEEVTQSFIKNIEKDKKLNSFVTKCSELALKKAKDFYKKPLDQFTNNTSTGYDTSRALSIDYTNDTKLKKPFDETLKFK